MSFVLVLVQFSIRRVLKLSWSL